MKSSKSVYGWLLTPSPCSEVQVIIPGEKEKRRESCPHEEEGRIIAYKDQEKKNEENWFMYYSLCFVSS